MGFGASLSFIAIGAILAFALKIDLSGVNIQMVGWILILVGLASMLFTFAYTRPRRRAAAAEVAGEEPVYVVHPEDAERPHEPVSADDPLPPPTPTDQESAAAATRPVRRVTERVVQEPVRRPQPGRHIGNRRM